MPSNVPVVAAVGVVEAVVFEAVAAGGETTGAALVALVEAEALAVAVAAAAAAVGYCAIATRAQANCC